MTKAFSEPGGVESSDAVRSLRLSVGLILDGDTVATGGFVGNGFAEELALALERRFQASGSPHDLTLVYAAGQGDGGTRGLNHFGSEGMVRPVIGGHWGLVPSLGVLALDDRIEATAGRRASSPTSSERSPAAAPVW